jgi:hypothetical protein
MSVQIGSKRLIWFEVIDIYKNNRVVLQPAKISKEKRQISTEVIINKEELEKIREDE